METELLLRLRKFLAPEIVYGVGALELVGRHAGNLGATRVFVVTDPGIQSAGWATQVEKSLHQAGLHYTTFSEVTANPKDYEVAAGAALYSRQECDLIVAVGGGSAMDCAKGIGVVAHNNGVINDYEGVDEIPNPGPPLIFIPTTAGTSADVSQFAIITDTKRQVKLAIVSKMVIPDIALVDPQTTLTMDPALTASTGMDGLCHAFEAYVSTASSALTDMAALAAVELIVANLFGAYSEPKNMEYRNNMMMASLMAGLAFSNASLGIVHAMAHSLGGSFDLAHGDCNALLLEKSVLFNYQESPEKYQRLAGLFGQDVVSASSAEQAELVAESVAALRRRLQINYCLADLGVKHSDLRQLAENASRDACLATNPRKAQVADIERIYEQVYA